ncbi:MAG: hypothetical protein JOZ73_06330 [Solirubrobacterales bacterium]|nr:hypothetical protein [Solirubrobacterales bacterium]
MPEPLLGFWQEGQRRLEQADASERLPMERVVDELVLELRRRLGGPFTLNELARLYLEKGTDWCFQIATQVAPRNPAAWDLPTVGNAAFARYAREATDFRSASDSESSPA